MKILIPYLTFGKDIFGGIENSLYNLASGLVETGNEVFIYTGRMCYIGENVDGIKIFYSSHLKSCFDEPVEDIDPNILHNYALNKNRIGSELLEIISLKKPDYILAIDHLWGILPYINIWEKINCQTGLNFHMNHRPDLIKKASIKPFTHFFCTSVYILEELKKISTQFSHRKVFLLPNSIKIQKFNSKYTPNKTRGKIIFCNARLGPEKGIEYLVHAFLKVLKKGWQARLLLCAGSFHFGSNRKVIEVINKIMDKNSFLREKIQFLPKLKWDDVPKYVKSADTIVLPTRNETFGIAALEALAAGIPLISTNTGNLPHLVQDAGILVKYGDIDAIAEAINKVFSEKSLVSKMIKKGKTIAKEYDYKTVAKNFVKRIGD
jgi:glycosyltransferase involved in cell wall biosynthesis